MPSTYSVLARYRSFSLPELSLSRAAGEDILDRALGGADKSEDVCDDKAGSQRLLLQLAGSLLAEGDGRHMRRNPRVVAAAAQLVGTYATWFARTAAAPVEVALRYLLRAMSVPEVRHVGSHGIKGKQ